MDIEHLTKTQIILLTLLVSFVTSIATGIVTVSLMQQAPPAIAQTVNRIVERTVEKVVPAAQTASVVQEKTVVIKEADLIAQALASVRPSVVQIYTASSESPTFLSLGVVLNKSGVIAADSSGLGDVSDVVIVLSGGQKVKAAVSRRDSGTGLSYFSTATSTTEGKQAVWMPASLSSGGASLGQTVFTITGKDASRISNGIVTALPAADSKLPLVETNVDGVKVVSGSALVATDGTVVGLSSGAARQSSSSSFIPASGISAEQKPTENADKK